MVYKIEILDETKMAGDLEKAIQELSMRMRLLRIAQEDNASLDDLSDRDIMILTLLSEQGKMPVSQIASSVPGSSDSTISTAITKLWRDKQMVSKTISPQSQRVTIVEITEKGKSALGTALHQRTERFSSLFEAIAVSQEERSVLIDVCNRAVKFMDAHFGLGTADKDNKT